ncbi:hypothetical protein DL95DRAFT_114071 [Leptodontidium sp. 2 PMI_412]|nr:hypothetical protein DL95DRAFT_114071 [Leptodontidium sp. 2 PMI_412]
MSTPFLPPPSIHQPTPFIPRPSVPPDESLLATSFKQQRTRIRALKLAVEECRWPEENSLAYSRQQEGQRRGDRLVREEAVTQTLLPHKAIDAEVRVQQKRSIFHSRKNSIIR